MQPARIDEPGIDILIVEDEAGWIKVLQAYLEKEGFKVLGCSNGAEGLELFRKTRPRLLLLDLMLPGMPGEEIARAVRKESLVPIIMLTARGSEDEKLQGLGIGADDYLVKPVSPREVTARVKTVLRRIEQNSGRIQQEIFQQGPFTIDTLSHRVYLRNKEVYLTPTEYHILKLLVLYPRKIFSRDNLADNVYGNLWEGDPRTVDVHIKNLRRKIEPDPGNPSYIKTVYGTGYQWGSPGSSKGMPEDV